MTTHNLLQLQAEFTTLNTEVLSIGLKFRVNNFLKSIASICGAVVEERNRLIFAIEPTGNIKPLTEEGLPNPQLELFNAQFGQILKEEIEVKGLPTIQLVELDGLKTSNNYPMLFELIIKE